MPNHFHLIIEIVGAISCGCPDDNVYLDENSNNYDNNNVLGNHKGLPLQKKIILGNIIGGFKSLTTNKYIKNEKSYLEISEYINNNHLKWDEDKFYFTEI